MNAVTNGESREILLVAHPGRRDITETAKRVGKIFERAGIGLRVLVDEADSSRIEAMTEPAGFSAPGLDVTVVHPGPDAAVGCELVLVLGGDGTFLRAAELAQEASIPVLGINLGRIGFLAETEAEHLDEALAQVVRKEYRVESRMTLDVVIRVDDEIIDRGWALNEASIENRSRLGVSRSCPRSRRPTGVCLRLRRCSRVHSYRLDCLRIFRRRPCRVARTRSFARRTQQRARAVRAAVGHQPEFDHRGGDRRR